MCFNRNMCLHYIVEVESVIRPLATVAFTIVLFYEMVLLKKVNLINLKKVYNDNNDNFIAQQSYNQLRNNYIKQQTTT